MEFTGKVATAACGHHHSAGACTGADGYACRASEPLEGAAG
jgi:hypothetical protein